MQEDKKTIHFLFDINLLFFIRKKYDIIKTSKEEVGWKRKEQIRKQLFWLA